MKSIKVFLFITFILLPAFLLINRPQENITITDSSYGLTFQENAYDLLSSSKKYNIIIDDTIVSPDDISCLYFTDCFYEYNFVIYKNTANELVISYSNNNTLTTICKITDWGTRPNLTQIESAILNENNNMCEIIPFTNLFNRTGVCIRIVESTLITDSFYIEIKENPELFLYSNNGYLSIQDINFDNCCELISSINPQCYYLKNNNIVVIQTSYTNNIKQLYYDNTTKNFTILYIEGSPKIVNINFENYNITPAQ